jgi:hypothetical protein
MDAYKKLCLLAMINTGREFELPDDTADTVQNCVAEMNQMSSVLMNEGAQGGDLMAEMKAAQEEGQHSLRIYNQIGSIFKEGDRAKLEALIIGEKPLLDKDANFGLAKQLLKRLRQKNITDLSAVYLTLSLKEILAKANMDQAAKEIDAERAICEMVNEGQA